LRLLGDMQAYEHDLPKVKRLAEMLGDAPLLAHLRWREAYTHRWFCRSAEARDAAEEGIRLSQAVADRSLEAMCWREVGRAARATGDYGDARVALERALSLFAGLGDVVHELYALSNLSTLYWRLGEHERAMHLALRALARCGEAELPLERRLPLGDVGVAAAAAGDVDLAWRCLLESLSVARQIADRTQEIFCLARLGWLCVQQKRAAEALEHLQAALALIHDIADNGFAFGSEDGGTLENVHFYNNIAYNNRYIGLSVSANGLSGPMQDIYVVNNTFMTWKAIRCRQRRVRHPQPAPTGPWYDLPNASIMGAQWSGHIVYGRCRACPPRH
jgi:tetratricopeptide (TPR) repeat protein